MPAKSPLCPLCHDLHHWHQFYTFATDQILSLLDNSITFFSLTLLYAVHSRIVSEFSKQKNFIHKDTKVFVPTSYLYISHSTLSLSLISLKNKLFILELFQIYQKKKKKSQISIEHSSYTPQLVSPLLTSCNWSGTFVTTDGPILIHCYYIKSILDSDFLSLYLISIFCSRIHPGYHTIFNPYVSLGSLWL